MGAIGLNHVSVGTTRYEETVRFYETVFGLEPVPTPNFGFRTQWFRCGDLQFHIFEHRSDQTPLRLQHFALDVDNFLEVYETASELGILDHDTLGRAVTELPDGTLQMYVRDPADNLIEVNWPDASSIDKTRIPELRKLSDLLDQDDENRSGSLYLDRPGFRSQFGAGDG